MQISKRCANNFSQRMEVERNLCYVKCRCKIIGKLIFIKILWKFFYPNAPIKGEFQIVFIILQTSYIIIFFVLYHPPLVYVLWIKTCLPITYLKLKASCRVLNCSKAIPDVITVRFGHPA